MRLNSPLSRTRTAAELDYLQSVSLSFFYRNNTLLDVKLGREWEEGLGRDETVARVVSPFLFNRHFFANALAWN